MSKPVPSQLGAPLPLVTPQIKTVNDLYPHLRDRDYSGHQTRFDGPPKTQADIAAEYNSLLEPARQGAARAGPRIHRTQAEALHVGAAVQAQTLEAALKVIEEQRRTIADLEGRVSALEGGGHE